MIHSSISLYKREQLKVPYKANWSSNNPLVIVEGDGWIYPTKEALRPLGIAQITATEIDGVNQTIFEVTIVPWSANRLRLDVNKFYTKQYIMTKQGNTIYSSVKYSGNELFTGDLDNLVKVSDLPVGCTQYYAPMLVTPNGYFIHSNSSIWYSANLSSWTKVFDNLRGSALRHMFDYAYDAISGNVYVFVGEYSTVDTTQCRVIKGIIPNSGEQVWETSLEFYSRSQFNAEPTLSPSCRHIHAVIVEKSSNTLWVGTGDVGNEIQIMRSIDFGLTWETVGKGTQDWRTLSIWFTEDYVYWNMDADTPQGIWRLPKANLQADKELVARLSNGTMWYHMPIKDHLGEDAILMAQSAEGQFRDENGRVFYIKELTDKTVEIEEVLLVYREEGVPFDGFIQIEPILQDDDGYVYFNGRSSYPNQNTRRYRLTLRGNQKLFRFVDPVKYVSQ